MKGLLQVPQWDFHDCSAGPMEAHLGGKIANE